MYMWCENCWLCIRKETKYNFSILSYLIITLSHIEFWDTCTGTFIIRDMKTNDKRTKYLPTNGGPYYPYLTTFIQQRITLTRRGRRPLEIWMSIIDHHGSDTRTNLEARRGVTTVIEKWTEIVDLLASNKTIMIQLWRQNNQTDFPSLAFKIFQIHLINLRRAGLVQSHLIADPLQHAFFVLSKTVSHAVL